MKLSEQVVWTIIYILSETGVRKKVYHRFQAIFVKPVSKIYLSRRNRLWYILVVRPISVPVLESISSFLSSDWLLKSVSPFFYVSLAFDSRNVCVEFRKYLEFLNIFYENGQKSMECPFSERLFCSICRYQSKLPT